MKKITIGEKEYTFKFSVGASLYNECTEAILDSLISGGKVQGYAQVNDYDSAINNLVTSISDIPKKALTLFYAGLIEYHGTGRNGDGTVKSIEDAQEILVEYIGENIGEDGKAKVTMASVFRQMMDIIGDDNFFEIAGINETLEQMMASIPKRKKTSKAGKK